MSETALHQAVTGGQDKEYLSFVLGDEHYALDITSVINLRGDIVPIVDLRIKFNVGEATYNDFTIVIMLNIQERIVGIVVDGVSDVIRLSEEQVLPPPEFGVAFDSRYLHGLADVDENMVILVNIESLITSEELGLVAPESVKDDA